MEYAARPSRAELVAVLVAGALHVITEVGFSEAAAVTYNLVVSIGFAVYLVWRARYSPGALRVWGMRLDNLGSVAGAYGTLVVVAGAMLVGYGLSRGPLELPGTFWMTVALYPVWGIAQQFGLQNLVARNLGGLFSTRFVLAAAAAGLFALAHYPRLDLVALTLVAGFVLTLVYQRYPNLWMVGTAHGILGSLTFYIVLGQDAGRELLELLGAL